METNTEPFKEILEKLPLKKEVITIVSSDRKFLVRLIDWLNEQEVEKDSTTLKLG